jgi:hypothetical protein
VPLEVKSFFLFFQKTLFFQANPLQREKTRFWQAKRHTPYSYSHSGLSEIAYEAK